MSHFSDEQMYLAESIADYLDNKELSSNETDALLKFRKELLCSHSMNQEYQCCIVMPWNGKCCDACLEHELYTLWNQGIITVGSCCGHGGKYRAYIQVLSDDHVQKMHELGYEQIPVDEYGFGQRCFVPKTKLIIS